MAPNGSKESSTAKSSKGSNSSSSKANQKGSASRETTRQPTTATTVPIPTRPDQNKQMLREDSSVPGPSRHPARSDAGNSDGSGMFGTKMSDLNLISTAEAGEMIYAPQRARGGVPVSDAPPLWNSPRISVGSQPIESTSDLSVPPLQGSANSPNYQQDPDPSVDWQSSDGILLHVPRPNTLSRGSRISYQGAVPRVRNMLIQRKGSCRLAPEEHAVEDASDSDAAAKRSLMINDWIDHHDFANPSTEEMKLVRWDWMSAHDKHMALFHAETRAVEAMVAYSRCIKRVPWGQKNTPLSAFADEADIDSESKELYNLDDLPDTSKANFDDDPRLPRTIVAQAKIYHTISEHNELLKVQVVHWMLFEGWLFGTPSGAGFTRTPKGLEAMGICEKVLKEGCLYIRKLTNEAIREYNQIVDVVRAKSKQRLGKLEGLPPNTFGNPPKDCWDLYTMPTKEVMELDLYPKTYPDTAENMQLMKQPVSTNFRRSLAFRATTLAQIRMMVDKMHDTYGKVVEGPSAEV